jgi:hypothetical protein
MDSNVPNDDYYSKTSDSNAAAEAAVMTTNGVRRCTAAATIFPKTPEEDPHGQSSVPSPSQRYAIARFVLLLFCSNTQTPPSPPEPGPFHVVCGRGCNKLMLPTTLLTSCVQNPATSSPHYLLSYRAEFRDEVLKGPTGIFVWFSPENAARLYLRGCHLTKMLVTNKQHVCYATTAQIEGSEIIWTIVCCVRSTNKQGYSGFIKRDRNTRQ